MKRAETWFALMFLFLAIGNVPEPLSFGALAAIIFAGCAGAMWAESMRKHAAGAKR